jgi:hypothetical protein
MKLNSRSICEPHIRCFTASQRAAEISDNPPIVRANGLKQYLVTTKRYCYKPTNTLYVHLVCVLYLYAFWLPLSAFIRQGIGSQKGQKGRGGGGSRYRK